MLAFNAVRNRLMETMVPTPEEEQLATMFHALGNPTRLAITLYIANHPGCICNDLVLRFDRAQATVSHHLATLRRAKVVIAEQDGPATCYWVNTQHVAWLYGQLGQLARRSVQAESS
jgi:ArsR family transcriptional regulator, arsenate/arsenite/antimonite-responsive transcriptional repressor